jgi:DNA-directed RNA polymerase specialized sigma24 family protein
MKRKDFYQLVHPLSDKLYRFAYLLLPDDLQAEQLVIDALNAYLLKEKKTILRKEIDLDHKKDLQVARRQVYKGILRYVCDIGLRRSGQLSELTLTERPDGYDAFYALTASVRMVMGLRYECQFSVEEIEEVAQMPRYEIIEKIHNGRHLLLSDLNQGVSL